MATLNVKNFPDDLYERIKRRAAAERRSIAGEVVQLLDRAVGEAEPRSILELRGLGKEMWREIDVAEYIRGERDSWD
jgi:plasmid stability protein